jgi:hypothetical protein
MMQAPDIGDLRPAPRQAPAMVLWSLFVVAIAGIGLLLWAPASTQRLCSDETARALASALPSGKLSRARSTSDVCPAGITSASK